MEILWRFLIGGALVSLFALLGDVLRPKSFAGLLGAAPSVALATLALTATSDGHAFASVEARSMLVAALGFAGYAAVCSRFLMRGSASALVVTTGGLTVWAGWALLGWAVLCGSSA